ncbi:MAG TPA: hypothetical protein VLF18_02885, partial [Tahibacter sp.]|uniref:hypothetical protein n=1 Tax=Tahibacter sp. TaxID=2056211 RepID=UPI002CB30E6A
NTERQSHRRYSDYRAEQRTERLRSQTTYSHSLARTRVRRRLQLIGDSRAYWIQVDVGHGCEQRALVAEKLTPIAPFPEPPFAAVFAIGTAGDRLGQATHEPRKVAEARANHANARRVCKKLLTPHHHSILIIVRDRKHSQPARRHFFVAPRLHGAGNHLNDNVKVIAHDCIGVDSDSKALSEQTQPIFDPVLSMLE